MRFRALLLCLISLRLVSCGGDATAEEGPPQLVPPALPPDTNPPEAPELIIAQAQRREQLAEDALVTRRGAESLKYYVQDKRVAERGEAPDGWEQPPMVVYEIAPRSHLDDR